MNRKPIARRLRRTAPFTALAVAGLSLSLAVAARADNLIMNGSFQVIPALTSSRGFGPVTSPMNLQQPLVNWTVPGGADGGAGSLQFVVLPSGNAADSGMIPNGISSPNNINLGVWGPGVGVQNGFRAPTGVECGGPATCNFVALDGDPGPSMFGTPPGSPVRGIIQQTVGNVNPNAPNALKPGSEYELTFYWASGQIWLGQGNAQTVGSTTAGLAVTLGGQTESVSNAQPGQTCPGNNNPDMTTPVAGCGLASRQFKDWTQATLDFTATASSELLTIAGTGMPSPLPPVALLTSLDLEEVAPVGAPEPSTWSLLGISFAALVGFAWWRRRVRVPDQEGEA